MNAANDQKRQLNWESRPFAELVRLGWPITVSMLSFSLMNLVDTLFVGWLGASSLAGVGLGGMAAFMAICFSFGLLRSTKVAISQAVGAGQGHEAGAFLSAALVIAAALSVFTVAGGLGVSDWLGALAATEAAGDVASDYFRVRMFGVPIWLAAVALREARYGTGDSRGPMVATVVGNAVNICLDWVFIFPLGGGAEGAAWATNVGALAEMLLLINLHRRANSSLAGMRRGHIATVWRLGVPLGAQFVVEVGAFAVLAAMISKLSEAHMAAHQIALQILHFSFLPALAVADAASILVGQAIGARREELVRPVARLALMVTGGYTGLCAIVLIFGGGWIGGWFTDESSVLTVVVQLFWIAAVFQLFDGANIVARGVLRGVGDVRVPAMISITLAWLCTPPLMWWLGYRMKLGAIGGWIGICAEIIIGSGILWWRLEREQWRSAAAKSRQDQQAALSANASPKGQPAPTAATP